MLKGVSHAMSSKDHPTRRPALQLVEVNGARRGALPGGDARHMLLQDSLLGALAVQVIWGLCWVASRTLGTLDQR